VRKATTRRSSELRLTQPTADGIAWDEIFLVVGSRHSTAGERISTNHRTPRRSSQTGLSPISKLKSIKVLNFASGCNKTLSPFEQRPKRSPASFVRRHRRSRPVAILI
jgi:hypothetical protein